MSADFNDEVLAMRFMHMESGELADIAMGLYGALADIVEGEQITLDMIEHAADALVKARGEDE